MKKSPPHRRSWAAFLAIAEYIYRDALAAHDQAGADALRYLIDNCDDLLSEVVVSDRPARFELVDSEVEDVPSPHPPNRGTATRRGADTSRPPAVVGKERNGRRRAAG